jgi:hypothetical protein
MTNKTDSTIKITPKLILIFLISVAAPMGSGVWLIADLSSRLSSLEDSIASTDTSDIVERIKAVEFISTYNERKVDKLDVDIDKIVEHVDKSFKKITDTMNSNPLSVGN